MPLNVKLVTRFPTTNYYLIYTTDEDLVKLEDREIKPF